MNDQPRDQPATAADRDQQEPTTPRRPFHRPKLTYVTPKLIRHGDIPEVTAGFFGGFYP